MNKRDDNTIMLVYEQIKLATSLPNSKDLCTTGKLAGLIGKLESTGKLGSSLPGKLVGASVSEPPLVDSTDALSRYIDRRAYVHRYCACAALRANVAGQIGNRFSPAESAFSACIGSGSSQSS